MSICNKQVHLLIEGNESHSFKVIPTLKSTKPNPFLLTISYINMQIKAQKTLWVYLDSQHIQGYENSLISLIICLDVLVVIVSFSHRLAGSLFLSPFFHLYFCLYFIDLISHIPLLQEIVLHPECEPIHDDGYNNNHEHQFQSGVFLDPTQQNLGNFIKNISEEKLQDKQCQFTTHHDDVPDCELKHPRLIVDSVFKIGYIIF